MKKWIPLFGLIVLFSCKPTQADFKLERVSFHSGPCFGICPSYHLQVNPDGSALLKGDSLSYKRGNVPPQRVGYFTGKVQDSTFRKLVVQLREAGLDTLKFKGPNCCDAPMKTLIVRYNGKRRYLHAMFPPDHVHGLLSTLRDIYDKTPWQSTAQRFSIEQDSVPQ